MTMTYEDALVTIIQEGKEAEAVQILLASLKARVETLELREKQIDKRVKNPDYY